MRFAPSLGTNARRRVVSIDRSLTRIYSPPIAALGNKSELRDEAISIPPCFETNVPRAKERWLRLRRAFTRWDFLERTRLSTIAETLREGGLAPCER